MARYCRRMASAHRACPKTGLRTRYLPGGMGYVERISERVAWGRCDGVRPLGEVGEGCFEVLQQLFIRLCL